ncbi:cell division septal protein [Halobacteroides halobius DSM 5150]|uniref:Cell division septal protein n=1 Tax=Halobacteroides halobius (strain ATCC 35273 / DSM 5150 / MD-1) TaxID=748449 RepID=L0KAY4_HALHC|nr:FtsQ-type POTRA domain-containing protein [Halobacteroides halobius]AGB41700.1 cell division septal protein [Halobacteroides halobius DSM 5150]
MDKQTILIMIGLLIVLATVNIIYSNYFQIREIKIIGNHLLSDQYVLNYSKVNKKDSIFAIDPENIEDKLLKLSQLKSVEVRRDLPNIVVIEIQERRPIAIIPFQSSYQVIDAQGWILEVSNNLFNWNLPLITGVNIKAQEKRINLSGNIEIAISYLSKLSKKTLVEITEVHVTSQGQFLLFLKQGGEVKLGNKFDIERKAKMLDLIYQDVKSRNLDVEYIDLRSKGNAFLKIK